MFSEDMRELKQSLANMSPRGIANWLFYNTDALVDDIEEKFGGSEEFQIHIAELRVGLHAFLRATRPTE